ncbi:hypothetical protein K1719_045814 [Acacia pycnantha]|nr:hypothetical protein K1719_045814 [Acacia pycnantha]
MSTGTDILVNCVGGVGANVVTVVVKQARYCWDFNDLVKDLGEKQELLRSTRKSMEVQVRKARANSRVPSEEIEQQMENAATLLGKAKKQQVKAKASSSCCNGVFPNLICRYIVGRQTEKMTNKIEELKVDLLHWLDFAHRSSLKAMSIPEDFILFETTKKARDEIITALQDNMKKKIGLYGMGGCGKSSMLKLVHKEAQDKKLFDKIAFVEVSDPPNISDIQQAIANWFDLDFETETPEHVRATRLSMVFEEGTSYLIILDNVWKMLKFDDIGIPFNINCKVLLSTRQQDKCKLMGCQEVIHLPLLNEEEAWTLFQKHAGAIKDRFKRDAEKISTNKCQRLPVAIKAVARRLKDQDEFVWEEALAVFKDRKLFNVDNEKDNPYTCLRLSLRELEEEEKSLFLLCAMFPNDSELTLETLIRFAFGLSIFQDVHSYQRARSRVRTVIKNFRDSCLLLHEKERYIEMHDMFRAVALSEANEKTRVITGTSQNLKELLHRKNYLKEATRLYCHGTEEFPDQLNSPELQILHMSSDNGNSSKIAHTFFEKMKKLTVLVIKNTSRWTMLPLLLPQSIEGPEELRTVCLNGWKLDNMSFSEKLEMLDSIELSYCEVKELPKELVTMKKLKLLEVSSCRIGGGNPYEVLARCSKLEELYFVKNSVQKVESNDQNVAKLIQQIASSKVLQRYHLEVGSSADTLNDDSISKYMYIINFDISILNAPIQDLARKLKVLFLEKVQGDCTSIIPGFIPPEGEHMCELIQFILRDCDSFECLIDSTKHQSLTAKSVFSKLEKLKVEAMKGMKALCIGPPPSGLLANLKELFLKHCSQLGSLGKLELLNLELIELEYCPKLTSLFTFATAQTMKMLQVLKVRGCSKLKHILTDEKKGYVFPELKHVTVKECKNLECIIPTSSAGGLSKLESLEVENAAALIHVFGESNYGSNQNQSQHILKLPDLKVFKLIGLKSIIGYCPPNYKIEWSPSLDEPYIVTCPLLSSMSEPSGGVEATKLDFKYNVGHGIAKKLARVATQKARFDALVDDLEHEKDILEAKVKEVEAKTIEPSGDLKRQLKKAKNVIEKAKKPEGEVEPSRSYTCGNWVCKFIESNRLTRMTEKMKQLNKSLASTLPSQTDHKDKSFSVVGRQPIAPYHSSNSEDFTLFESTKKASNELLVALKDGHINIIGLYGMAGCGKTSLVMEVCKAVKGLKLFDDVIYVTVSRDPNVKSIQATIADWLGLLLIEETEVGKAQRLRQRLKMGGKFLLVLDDMWSVLDLGKIGIPFDENCKVILTTRFRSIVPLMGCQKEVSLPLLSEEEAWDLFHNHVGAIEKGLEVVAQEIVEECQGLPVAILAIARALRGKKVAIWEKASEELRDSLAVGSGSGQETVYESLLSCVDEFQDQARSLFLLCAVFPKHSKISPEILTRFAFGLSIFGNGDSYPKARDIVDEAINEMNNSRLLLKSKEGHFQMHNWVLKAALWVAKETRVINGLKENISFLIKGGLMKDISRLYCHDMHEFHYQLNCPELEILVVSNDDGRSSEFPDAFFMQMTELKVLAIIDSSVFKNPNLLLPQSFERLKKLRTLCLRGWTLGDISVLGNLEMLDTIELLYCVIKELPEEFVDLKKLKLLEISGSKMGGNPFNVLARCSQLEELYFIGNNVVQEVESNNHYVVELFHRIGSSEVLQKYHLEIGSSIDILKQDAMSKFISINDFNVTTANEALQNLAQKLDVFYLEKIEGNCKNIIPDMIPANGECANKLTEFLLYDSDNIECLIDTTNYKLYQPKSAFPMLLKLRIKSMKCLEALGRGSPPFDLFEKLEELFIVECSQLHCIVSVGNLNLCNLKHLQLEDCPKMTSVFTYSTARTMVLLEVLKVRDCNALQHIIKNEEEDDITSLGPLFPKLKQVSVTGCENLEFILPASFVGFLELESLEINDAGELKYIFGIYNHEEGQIQRIIDLPVLKVLKLADLPNICNICPQNCQITWLHIVKAYIRRCPRLRRRSGLDSKVSQLDGDKFTKQTQELKLAPKHSSEMALRSVESIHIEDCEVEGIFQFTQPAAINMQSNSLLLSSLQSLALNNLPHVRYICEGYKQLFSLRRVKIYKCGELKCIFSLRILTYISSLRELAIEDCYKLEQIIEDEDYESQYTGPFSDNYNLERMTVKSCPRLRSLFSVSTAKTLTVIRTLKIEGCHGMAVLMNEGNVKAYSSEETREEHGQVILPNLGYLSLKDLPRLIQVCEGNKLITMKDVLFPESFNLSNLQRMTVKSCPRLRSLFTESTAKTLTWLNTMEIEECFELEYVIKGKNNDFSQGGSKDLVPSLRTLRLLKLPRLIVFYQGIRLQCELFQVRDCPNLKQTLAVMSEPEDLPKEYKSPENYSLSLTYSKKGKGVATVASTVQVDNPSGVSTSSSSFHLLKKGDISAADNHHQSQEAKVADASRRLPRAEEESLNKDPAPEEFKVGNSSLDLIVRQPLVVKDPQQNHQLCLQRRINTLQQKNWLIFMVYEIEARRALLLEEAFVKYPHLEEWKLPQKNPKICDNSLAKMLKFLKS